MPYPLFKTLHWSHKTIAHMIKFMEDFIHLSYQLKKPKSVCGEAYNTPLIYVADKFNC